VRAGHARVGDRRGATRQDTRVVGLDVGVRADDRGDAAVEPRGERNLLARRLGVEVDDDDRSCGARLVDEHVDDLPRRDGCVEEELPEQVEDGDADTVACLHHGEAAAWSLGARVRRPDHALAPGEVGGDPAPPVGVVAERDYVRPRSKELVGELPRDAGAVGGVLAVDDREVGLVALAQRREVLLHRAATRDAEDVREEEDLQGRI